MLLRLLNERIFDGAPIPLMTAVATANPTRDDYYVEQLDPAHLDRFTFQVKAEGLISSLKRPSADGASVAPGYQAAVDVVRRFGGSDPRAAVPSPAEGEEGGQSGPGLASDRVKASLAVGWEVLPEVVLGPAEPLLLELLRVLVTDHGCDSTNSLLSDRTFLSRAPMALRATALLAAPPRHYCIPEDLRTLQWDPRSFLCLALRFHTVISAFLSLTKLLRHCLSPPFTAFPGCSRRSECRQRLRTGSRRSLSR